MKEIDINERLKPFFKLIEKKEWFNADCENAPFDEGGPDVCVSKSLDYPSAKRAFDLHVEETEKIADPDDNGYDGIFMLQEKVYGDEDARYRLITFTMSSGADLEPSLVEFSKAHGGMTWAAYKLLFLVLLQFPLYSTPNIFLYITGDKLTVHRLDRRVPVVLLEVAK
jgi:hypothetical protein